MWTWSIRRWSSIKPLHPYLSDSFEAGGLKWALKYYKGRAKNAQYLSTFLTMVDEPGYRPFGIKKRISIVFIVANHQYVGNDHAKIMYPVIFSSESMCHGEESLILLDTLIREYASLDKVTLRVRFQITASSDDPPVLILRNEMLLNLLKSTQYHDVEFLLNDAQGNQNTITANRAMLSAASEVFAGMLNNGMRESTLSSIPLPDVTYDAFAALIGHIYSDVKVFDPSSEEGFFQVVDLLGLCDRYAVFTLRDHLLRELRTHLSLENVFIVWAIAAHHQCLKTQKVCLQYAASHAGDFIEKTSICYAKPELIENLFASDALNFDKTTWERTRFLNTTGEFQVWRLFETWLVDPMTDAEDDVQSVDRTDEAVDMVVTQSRLDLSPRDLHRVKRKKFLTPQSSPTGAKGVKTGLSPFLTKALSDPSTLPFVDTSSLSERQAHLPHILPYIRFPLFSKDQLFGHVEQSSTALASEPMKTLLIEAYRYHLGGGVVPMGDWIELDARYTRRPPTLPSSEIIDKNSVYCIEFMHNLQDKVDDFDTLFGCTNGQETEGILQMGEANARTRARRRRRCSPSDMCSPFM